MDGYTDSPVSPEEEQDAEILEELEEVLEGGTPVVDSTDDDCGPEDPDVSDPEVSEEDLAVAQAAIAGEDGATFDLSPRAQQLRSRDSVQKVVADIRSSRTADEIADLMKQDPTKVPMSFIDESAYDFAVLEEGDTNIGSPLDVASAVWAELHSHGEETADTPSSYDAHAQGI